MKKQITRSLCCLLSLLLCLGSAIYTPAAQDDQTQVSFTVTLATGKATDYATLQIKDALPGGRVRLRHLRLPAARR